MALLNRTRTAVLSRRSRICINRSYPANSKYQVDRAIVDVGIPQPLGAPCAWLPVGYGHCPCVASYNRRRLNDAELPSQISPNAVGCRFDGYVAARLARGPRARATHA